MAIDKIISAPSGLDQIRKINEIIDAVNEGGGGGTLRNIGEIVQSTVPLNDSGLHLADGSVLQYGSYKAFIDYIASLYNEDNDPRSVYAWVKTSGGGADYRYTTTSTVSVSSTAYTSISRGSNGIYVYIDGTSIISTDGSTTFSTSDGVYERDESLDKFYHINNIFTNDELWQTSVTTYGVCGKFVYDSTNNTVRLPRIVGFTESTIDVTTLGNLTEAGLPNITGTVQGVWNGSCSGAIYNATHSGGLYDSEDGGGKGAWGTASFSAQSSNSIYDNSDTVQPQSIKVLYYIVVANTIKTEIEVDIDEIATDLNNKANVDLSNTVLSNCKNIDGQFIPIQPVEVSSSTAVGSYTHDLSNILPNDNYNYLIECFLAINSSSDTRIYVGTVESPLTNNTYCGSVRSTSNCRTPWNNFIIPVYSDRKIYSQIYKAAASASASINVVGYRRMGTNN